MADHAAPARSSFDLAPRALRALAARLTRRGEAATCRPIRAGSDLGPPLDVATAAVWMTPPPERRLPRDLDVPMWTFDPGAMRNRAPIVAPAGWTDPIALERMLRRLQVAVR